jgi:hypothetical protein
VRVVVFLDQLFRAHGLGCAAGSFDYCQHDRSKCAEKAGFYVNNQWSRCPVREVLDDSRMTAALQVERQSKISPIANWPSGYAAWVPEYVCAISAAREERASSEAERHGKWRG